MRERSILMNAESVRAILAGRKTQTRRVMRPQPPSNAYFNSGGDLVRFWVPATFASESNHPIYDEEIRVPYQVGDLLWVREAWAVLSLDSPLASCGIAYRADGEFAPAIVVHPKRVTQTYGWGKATRLLARRWRPSIHMPRWASRITLRVTGVRVERVQAISEDDAKAEGVEPVISKKIHGWTPHALEFCLLWNNINAKRGFGWDTNPWVWVVSFERFDENK